MQKNLKFLIILLLLLGVNDLFAQDFAKTKIAKNKGTDGENYSSFTFDGAWCWFSDPRAIYYEGKHKRTYSGWVDSYGDIYVGYYDHETKEVKTHVLYDSLQVDDHDTPALLIDKNGRLKVFFSKHATAFPIQLYTAKNPEDIFDWEKPQTLKLNDPVAYKGFSDSYTYQNPIYLPAENKYYIFWRGADWKPNYSVSTDECKTWSKGKIFVLPERIYRNRRPYMKVSSNGKDRIDFAFTDGHPRNEPHNSIYYMYYKNGGLYKANGERIGDLGKEPVKPSETSVVYDATIKGNPKAWIWDVAEDKDKNPVLVYAKFPNDTTHIYSYARWDGKKWAKYDLINSGRYFERGPKGKPETEPNYSAGLAIDHEDPNILYLSVNRDSVFEIEKWTTNNGGEKWNVEAVTRGSSKDNIRPFPIRNAGKGNPLQLLWVTNTRYVHYINYLSSIKIGLKPENPSAKLDSTSIVQVMQKTANWQLANPAGGDRANWTWGAFYTGLMTMYNTTHDEKYLNEVLNVGQNHHWELVGDVFHADQMVIGQSYADAYMIKKDPKMLEHVKKVMDMHVNRTDQVDVRFAGNHNRGKWWSWCDALYMAPPAFAKVYAATGEEKYLDYMDEHWWKTSDYLYSKKDSLFYRDDSFFDKKSPNGKSVFWGRGNGWVIAGLARLIPYLPKDYKDRDKFITQYREMAYKILALQRDHGLWTASLYDPEQLPMGETSGSAFFTYALAWGINYGILPRDKFELPVKKAWAALVHNVNEEGRLGYVQQVAGSPYPFTANQWHVYATGAFLLAGHEMIDVIKTDQKSSE